MLLNCFLNSPLIYEKLLIWSAPSIYCITHSVWKWLSRPHLKKMNCLKYIKENFFLWCSAVAKRMLNHECLRMILEQLWKLSRPNLTIFPKRPFNLETRSCFLFPLSCPIIKSWSSIFSKLHNELPSSQGSLYFQRWFIHQWKLSSCLCMPFIKGEGWTTWRPCSSNILMAFPSDADKRRS